MLARIRIYSSDVHGTQNRRPAGLGFTQKHANPSNRTYVVVSDTWEVRLVSNTSKDFYDSYR